MTATGRALRAKSHAVQLAAFKVWVDLRYPPERRGGTSGNTPPRVEVVVLKEEDIEEKP